MKTGWLIGVLGGVVIVGIAGLVVLGVALAGRETASAAPDMRDARETCLLVYKETPRWIEAHAEQTGEPSSAATLCDTELETRGEAGFVEFWTTPSQYIPASMKLATVEAYKEAGIGD